MELNQSPIGSQCSLGIDFLGAVYTAAPGSMIGQPDVHYPTGLIISVAFTYEIKVWRRRPDPDKPGMRGQEI